MSAATALSDLFETPDLPDLGPRPRAGTAPEVELHRKLDAAFQGRDCKVEPASRDLVRTLALLWHDHIDSAHEIAQRIDTADASYLHGIVHRREPDYGNAKYWFTRAEHHPCFAEIARRVRARLDEAGERVLAQKLVRNDRWDANAFVDACEADAHRPSVERTSLLRSIQQIEFAVLLEYLEHRAPQTVE